MKKIVLLTSKENEDYIHDDELFEKELVRAGFELSHQAWEELTDNGEDLFILRTTWNYTDDFENFMSKIKTIKDRLWNPYELVEWNSDKHYLFELQEKGVDVITLKQAHDQESLICALDELAGDDFIVKPFKGAGAKGLIRFTRENLPKITEPTIVQEFLPEITQGEISLIFFGGEYSHGLKKVPKEGEIRVQEEFGGKTIDYQPTPSEMQNALKALSLIPCKWLYARVDIVPGKGIIELECIEPSLYFSHGPESPKMLVDSIKKL